MKTNVKNKVICSLACVATACTAFSLALTANSLNASAITEATEAQFYVEDGASVRTTEGTSGIRFTTRISADYYNSVKDKNPMWGTVIGYEVADAESLTTDAVNGTTIRLFEPKNVEGEVVKIQPMQDGEDYIYKTVISFNQVDAEKFELACNTKLNVRSFVTYTDGTETTVHSYVDGDTDTFRSVTEVAEKVLVDDALGDGFYQNPVAKQAKDVLKGYINAKIISQTVSEKLAYTYDMADTGDKLTGLDVADGTYELIVNNTEMGEYAVSGGEVTLNENFPTLTLGEKYTVVLKGASGVTVQAFQYVSQVITTNEEFLAILTAKTAAPATPTYYLLGNDIGTTEAGGSLTVPDASNYHFYDVLDGNGKKVIVNNITKTGIFGTLENNAVVKNVYINCTYAIGPNNGAINTNIIAYKINAATVKNTCITYTPASAKSVLINIMGYTISSSAKFEDIFLYTQEDVTASSTGNYYDLTSYIGANIPAATWATSNVSNFYAVTQLALAGRSGSTYFCASNETVTDRTSLDNVTRYADLTEMVEKGLTKVGSWTINADGTASWNPTADTFVPEYTEEERLVVIDKTEHNLVNSYETEADGAFTNELVVPVSGLTAGGGYEVFVNGKLVADAVVGEGLVTFPIANAELTLGEVHTLTVGDHVQPFRYITKVITTAEEFMAATQSYSTSINSIERQRYYLVGADIDHTEGATSWKIEAMTGYRFFDVLDGDGHTLTVNNCVNGGVFGNVHTGAVIKNVCIKNTYNLGPNGAQYNTSILGGSITGATIKNVTLVFVPNISAEKAYQLNFLAFNIDKNTVVEDVYAYFNPFITLGTSPLTSYGVGYVGGNLDASWTTAESKGKNLYFVTSMTDATKNKDGRQYIASNDTVENATKLTGVYRYATVDAMKNAGVKQVGNWIIGDAGAVTYDANSYVSNQNNTSNGTVNGSTAESVVMAVEQELAIEGTAKSGNEAIVKVENGKLVAVAAGKTVISVTNGKYTRIVYVVVEDPTASATVAPLSVAVDGVATISVSADEAVGYLACTVIEGGENVSVSGNVVTGVQEGTATLSVAFQIGGVVKVVEVTVTVA